MLNEKGVIRKDPGGKLNIALVYPNTYWTGMSNLGVHTMYRVFNEHPGILCERLFFDTPRSIESLRLLSSFHIIAFSISYELDLINAVRIMIDNKIPLEPSYRKGRPFVIAGGPVITLNPEPVAHAMDVCFLGDGEKVAEVLHEAFFTGDTYEKCLDKLQEKDGIYIPARTYPTTKDDHITGFKGSRPVISTVAIDTPAHTQVIARNTVFGDMFLIESARGCPWGCKFCGAREIYRPFRPVEVRLLEPLFKRSVDLNLKLGLVSAALNDHPDAVSMYDKIRAFGAKIAPPSLRSGMITEDLLELMKASQVKGVTLAPETGSQDLRYSIGKRISDDIILDDIHALVVSGIRDIKLYFLIGLPLEDNSDIEAIIDMVKRIRQIFIKVSKGNKRIGHISVNINTMVPKPHTFYERFSMIEPLNARDRTRRIVKGLKGLSNVMVSFESPKWAYLQGLLARGDRRVLNLIVELAKREASKWQEVLKVWSINPDWYVIRNRPEDEILPWSFY